jgi:phosphoribosyl 1,2-cyclic phosphodiesterase
VHEFESGAPFTFRDIRIDPFQITHDACDPVGFRIDSSTGNIGIATDLGIATRLVRDKLKGCEVLVIESNHDEELLNNGPYPWHLKQRIRSRHGHLSNSESAELLQDLIHPALSAVFLAHLSEINNDPRLVFEKANEMIKQQTVSDPLLIIGSQGSVSTLYSA